MGRLKIQKIDTHQVIKKLQKKLMFLPPKISISSELNRREPRLYPSVTGRVDFLNMLIQETHNHTGKCISFKMSRRTPKEEWIQGAKIRYGSTFLNTDVLLFLEEVSVDTSAMD